VPGNLVFESEAGNEQAVDAAFSQAAHITRLKVRVSRVSPSPLEPRACLVTYEPASGAYTLYVCMQGSTFLRWQMGTYTNLPDEKLEFVAQDVGGGFGQRSTAYPEYCALMIAAEATRRPIKWVSSRVEGFLTDTHGRANIIDGALAVDADGRFIAMRLDWINDMGAYLSPGAMGHIRNTTACMTGVYRIPALYATYRVPLTNTTPVSAYRGAGRPDAAYAVERLVDMAAAELGIDRAELRRRNFIPPSAFPYKTPTGSVYDNADLPGLLEQALALADWARFEHRREASRASGRLRGLGIATWVENTAAGRAPRDEVEIEVDADGTVTVHTVSKSSGNGHETTQAMIVADRLGIPRERVIVEQCAPGKRLVGNHTSGSRSTVGAGSACYVAAQALIEKGKALAALALDVEPSQVTYAAGEFRSDASPRSVRLADLARDRTFSVIGGGTFGSTFPNGCHIAEVEIDPETGACEIVSYCAVDDCGVVINHAIVEGQIHGGVVQGAGQIFGEEIRYDPDTGQPLTASFMDYYMPRAGLLRELRAEEHPTPSTVSPLGVKGVGESGCTASLPALTSAVIDALRPLGIRHLDMPFTPAKLWDAIRAARESAPAGRG
jgi:carbon-monoxide dehydrogenase large subunit